MTTGPIKTPSTPERLRSGLPQDLLRLQPRHIEQMSEHSMTMAVRNLGQFDKGSRDIMCSLVRPPGSRTIVIA